MIVPLTLFFLRNVMFIHVYLANKFFISILTRCKKQSDPRVFRRELHRIVKTFRVGGGN